jgi:hypothetical protein
LKKCKPSYSHTTTYYQGKGTISTTNLLISLKIWIRNNNNIKITICKTRISIIRTLMGIKIINLMSISHHQRENLITMITCRAQVSKFWKRTETMFHHLLQTSRGCLWLTIRTLHNSTRITTLITQRSKTIIHSKPSQQWAKAGLTDKPKCSLIPQLMITLPSRTAQWSWWLQTRTLFSP